MATEVTGAVRGVAIPDARAVSVRDRADPLVERHTLWIGSGLTCQQLLADTTGLGAASRAAPDGGVLPTLILRNNGQVWFDGVGVAGTLKQYEEIGNDDTTLRGSFTVEFDDGIEHAGTFSGTFVAPRCEGLAGGCSTGGGLISLAALLWLVRVQRSAHRRRAV